MACGCSRRRIFVGRHHDHDHHDIIGKCSINKPWEVEAEGVGQTVPAASDTRIRPILSTARGAWQRDSIDADANGWSIGRGSTVSLNSSVAGGALTGASLLFNFLLLLDRTHLMPDPVAFNTHRHATTFASWTTTPLDPGQQSLSQDGRRRVISSSIQSAPLLVVARPRQPRRTPAAARRTECSTITSRSHWPIRSSPRSLAPSPSAA